ncbi:carbohydrate kinase family protein [Sinorhizobium sp. RAC02]|uniref:carbohydrate kinase family protein n=1 Tax=Sinorhizobium sp. RAC02 TaxID=1842534 RepID=UPI00083D1473|nr:carbohydrate kinase family protein [Sinorhizobium sp. RAC02]AOF93860.1 pfkB carbohydrate kinase family protein [Sinorhizobium sp. RAC02]
MLARQERAFPYDVVLAGEYYFDLIFSGLGEMPRLGADVWSEGFDAIPGANFTTARALSLLNTRTGWWCETGSDLFSSLMIGAAEKEGMDTSLFQRRDENRIRVSAAFSMAGDRGFISRFDGDETLPAPEMLERLRPRVLLIQGLTCRRELAALFAFARAQGIYCCFDCQHVDEALDEANLVDILTSTDCFLLNDTEAARLTGRTGFEALDVLGRFAPLVVLKRGAQGAALLHRGEGVLERPAPVVEVIDTTGAGDSFNAGFVYGLLQGWTLEKILDAAIHCGSAAVTDHGGKALPDEADLLRRVQGDERQHDILNRKPGDMQ